MMQRIVLPVLVVVCAVSAIAIAQKFDELAPTPPMGWNSWNHFGCDVSEELIRETADAMVATGMRDAGYVYVNIDDCWHGDWSSWGVMRILDMQAGLRIYAGPGHWNDPDMMEVGNGMSESEDRAHFSMWAMLAAPLIAGNDLRTMSGATQSILTNREVIAIDQDPLGIQGFKYSDDGDLEIWFKPLAEEDWAMCILNRGTSSQEVELAWQDEAVVDDLSGRKTNFEARLYRIRDLWTGEYLGTTRQKLVADLPGHDVLMLRLVRQLKP